MQHSREEILKHVQSELRKEKLEHGNSTYNIFSLLMAGLLVIIGGIIASENISLAIQITITVGLPIILTLILLFILNQRRSTNTFIRAIRMIENELDIVDLLPADYHKPLTRITHADLFLILTLIITVIIIVLCVWIP